MWQLRIKTGKEPSKLDVFIHSRQGKQMDELTSQTIVRIAFSHFLLVLLHK